jgi:hypothetical protein
METDMQQTETYLRGQAGKTGARSVALAWRPILVLALVLLIGAAAVAMHMSLWQDENTGRDIESIYDMSRELGGGVNPYERILPGQRSDGKYAIYLPLFYIFGALLQKLGAADYGAWLGVWRVANLASLLGIGALLFGALYRRGLLLAAFFALLYWLFSRWTLYITVNAQIDLPAVLCLVASMLLFRTHRRSALLLLGVSLALKHVAIFIAPLYLCWAWQDARQDRLWHVARTAIWIAALPVAISLPFVFWHPEAFRDSMIYSLSRGAGNHFKVASLDELLRGMYPSYTGVPTRIPLIGLMLLIYAGALRRQIPMFIGALFVMAVFIDFSSVVFRQHLTWLVPMVPLALCDAVDRWPALRGARWSLVAERKEPEGERVSG